LAAAAPLIVARSSQPDRLYAAAHLRAAWRERRTSLKRVVAHAVYTYLTGRALASGQRRASVILCLGSRETESSLHRHPAWAARTRTYHIAPPPADQRRFRDLRRQRPAGAAGDGVRFLWIGRWAAHKGTRRLIDWVAGRAVARPEDRF
jgi:hypothetical protein